MKKFDYNNINVSYYKNSICIVTLNRPPVNALSSELLSDIKDIFNILEKDADLRVIILNSNLNHFSAGADLKERSIMKKYQSENALNSFKDCFEFLSLHIKFWFLMFEMPT